MKKSVSPCSEKNLYYRTLPIGLGVVIRRNKIILIKREKEPYQGLLGLPGGKIEKGEHLSTGLIREIKEETGIKTNFKEYLGLVSEFLIENGKLLEHFHLHISLLRPLSDALKASQEGIPLWFSLRTIDKIKEKIIPSDFQIIKNMVIAEKKKKPNYFECVLEKVGRNYILRKFENYGSSQ